MRRQPPKFPERLYISPPPTPTSPSATFLNFATATASSAALFSETSTAVGERIPGFKTSAAFFTTLRANLSLAAGDLLPSSGHSTPSQLSTPDSLRPTTTNMSSSISSLPPPSPSPLSNPPEHLPSSPTESRSTTLTTSSPSDIPPLNTSLAKDDSERIAALKVVADSVAQQRQLASSAVIYHPLTLSLIVLVIAILQHYMTKGALSDWAIVGTTTVGLMMAGLTGVRWMVSGYIDEAERVGTWAWLEKDEVLVSRFGEEVIGTVVLKAEGEDGGGTAGKKARKAASGGAGNVKGVIRAWTVKRRYRGKEIGVGLLEESVRLCRERGWSGPTFADDHANSQRVLYAIFNSGFDKREGRARKQLEKIVGEMDDVSAPAEKEKEKEKGTGRRKK